MTEVRKFYVDTSVVVARYKPRDELHDASERLFEKKTLDFYVSPLSIVELHAVLSRVSDQLDIPSPVPGLLNSLVAFVISDCALRIIGASDPSKKKLGNLPLSAPAEYYLSMRLAQELQLRTLDLIHLAHASIARARFGASGFVTGDKEILSKSEPIRRTLKLMPVHPDVAARGTRDGETSSCQSGRTMC